MIATHPVARALAATRTISSKSGLKLGSALGAVALMALAQPAFAQNECGSPNSGTVTCTSAGNDYPNGVTYVAPPVDLTINLDPDVIIDTSGALNVGVRGAAVADRSLTLRAAPTSTIRTDGVAAFGVRLATDTGAIDSTSGIIRTSGDLAAGVLATSPTGNITITGGNTATTGAGANGLEARGGSGTIMVTPGTVSTTGAGSNGVVARSLTGNVTITGGTISTTGINAVGATAETGATGTATISGGTISTAGVDAYGAVVTTADGAAVAAPTSVTTTGVGADAVRVTSTGNTARATVTTINTSGSNARGVVASGAQGATVNYGTVTTTGVGATGVLIPGGLLPSSTATVTGSGRLSTAGANADGINATATNGVTINVGQVATSGANSRGVVALGGGAVSVTSTGVTTTGTGVSATSTAGAAAVALSGVNSSATADGVIIAAATTANLSLASGGTLTGGGNGATIASGTGTTVTNAGTLGGSNHALVVTGGAANVTNSGTLNGRILLTGNGDTLTNSGTFNATAVSDFGAGNDTLNNSGLYNLSANVEFGTGADVFNNSGTLLVRPGTTTAGTISLLNLETLNNSGLIDLRNGHTGDVLTLPGSFAGSGASALGLDVNLIGMGSTADQLRFGGAASGTTTVTLAPVNAGPAVLNSGVVLVQAGAASPANAFALNGAQVDQGLIQYGLTYNPTNFSYNLVATPGAGVYRTALFAEGARNLWLQSGDAWSGHMRELRDNVAANGAGGAGGRFWAQALGQVEQRKNTRSFTNSGVTTAVNLGYEQDYFGGQIGLDFGAPAGDGGFAFGVTGGYLNSKMNFANSADALSFDAVNGGAYATYSGGMLFVNLLGKYDYYWGDNRSVSGRYTDSLKGSVYGGKAEVGLRFGDALFVEPSASVSYTKSDFGDFGVASGNFAFDSDEGIRGKAGARIGSTMGMGGSKVTLYAGGNYVHEFRGSDNIVFTSGGQAVAFSNNPADDYGEATLGLNIGSDQGAVSGFFEGRYANGRDYQGYGGRAGMRFRF